MKIQSNDHGRSLLEQLREMRGGQKADKRPEGLAKGLKHLQDVFEKTADKTAKNGKTDAPAVADQNTPQTVQADGLNISFQFDLFYELTSKVEAKMGVKGAERFVELSGTVSETFMGNFSLSIDTFGSFMNGTDKSLDLSPEVTNEFFDAVEGLADLSPEALENFLKESDEFFAELENTYGPANGAFDQIKSTMQEQAKAFFADVESVRQSALAGPQMATPALPEALPTEGLPAETVPATELPVTVEGDKDLIELLFQPGKKVSQNDYKNFLEEFWKYAEKFRQQMLEGLFNNRSSGYAKQGKASDESESVVNSMIDTAV
ncbi:MAG: hypothetical protein CVV42_17980 [Candidatus Riflebacteria bacterium HGW-Riflebacteria-2]|jgi:hypothetical protein|nr:MAG: hypothetical protein CVV42_17980 [Candidatus Riflebacteria bacterium HGW-Riflebacteria-2]